MGTGRKKCKSSMSRTKYKKKISEYFRKRELEKTGPVGRGESVLRQGAANEERVKGEPRSWRLGLELSPPLAVPLQPRWKE